MLVFETLAPLLLLIGLGAALAHLRFLGREFMADLNKLTFFVALPALIFVGVAEIEEPSGAALAVIGVLTATTVAVTGLGWLVSRGLHLPGPSAGTLMQAAFRANLGYIGIPVLAYLFAGAPEELRRTEMATALLVMAAVTTLYNVLAVAVLQGAQGRLTVESAGLMVRGIASNPLVIAGLAGMAFPLLGWRLPTFVSRTLDALGDAAVPVALLCIGGSLATLTFRGRRTAIVWAAGLKVVVAPLLAGGFCALFRVPPADTVIALIFAACPTAVASYVMAGKLKGDEPLASGSIALSTVLSGVSLAVVVWLVGVPR